MEFETVPMPADTVPAEICEKCAAGAIFHRETKTAAVYCEHSMTGAVYPLGASWGLVKGVEAHYFRGELLKALTKAELLGDVAGAIGQWLIDQSKRSTKH